MEDGTNRRKDCRTKTKGTYKNERETKLAASTMGGDENEKRLDDERLYRRTERDEGMRR